MNDKQQSAQPEAEAHPWHKTADATPTIDLPVDVRWNDAEDLWEGWLGWDSQWFGRSRKSGQTIRIDTPTEWRYRVEPAPLSEAPALCPDCQHPLGEHDGDGECWHRTHENTCPCDRGPVKPVEPAPPRPAATVGVGEHDWSQVVGGNCPYCLRCGIMQDHAVSMDIDFCSGSLWQWGAPPAAAPTPEQGDADAAWEAFCDHIKTIRYNWRPIHFSIAKTGHEAGFEAGRKSGEKPLTDEERQWLQTYREKKAQGFGPSWINLTPVERPSFSIDEDGDL